MTPPDSPDFGARPGALAESLLEGPARTDGPGAWVPYSRLGAILLSLFIAYHALAVVLYNLPNVERARALLAVLDQPFGMTAYMAINGNPRGWGLFAPDSNQANYFTKVLVEDAAGRTRDLQVDVYGRRSHPYVFYDRLGGLNRRVAQGETALRPFYAAWFCRDWERSHGGEPARAVTLVRLWTRIPPPETVYATGGYHPMGLFPNEDQKVRFECAVTPGGRLPSDLRRRYGLPPRADATAPGLAPAPSSPPESGREAGETSRDGY